MYSLKHNNHTKVSTINLLIMQYDNPKMYKKQTK